MLNTASSRFSCSMAKPNVTIAAEAPPEAPSPPGTIPSNIDAPIAKPILLAGPARAITRKSRRGFCRFAGLTGTGLAQPNTNPPKNNPRRGSKIVPSGSMCTMGFSEILPNRLAVGSPYQSAVTACAISWIVRENSRTERTVRLWPISGKLGQHMA